MKQIMRKEYLDWLIGQRGKDAIKVISGVRRSGKSTLLEIYKGYLAKNGVREDQIVAINFEDIDFEHLTDYRELHSYIKARLLPGQMTYLFLDEIQHVANYEKAVDSLFIRPDTDIYLTGSNAYFLSTELATLLTGRVRELRLLPLSFKEFCQGDFDNLQDKFDAYIKIGSFPYNLVSNSGEREAREYLSDLFGAILYKDIVKRNNVSNGTALENVADFMFHSIGSPLNPTKIANALSAGGNRIDVKTVQKYQRGLCESLLFYEARRFNIKGKQFLDGNAKYYAVDAAMRNMRVGGIDTDIGHILENIVFLELRRRYDRVFVGEPGKGEVDFVVKASGGYKYFQVTAHLTASNRDREIGPLEGIKDNYPKTILTLDPCAPEGNVNGIETRNVLKWLCGMPFEAGR